MRANVRPRERARRAAWLVGLVLLVFAAMARAAPVPIHTNGTPRFGAVIPDGFEPVRTERGTSVFAMYRRTRDEVLLVFTRLPYELPQDGDLSRLVGAAREADPFPFTDTPTSFHTLGFDVPGAHGAWTRGEVAAGADSGPRTVHRWMAIVPAEGRAFAVLAIAPDEHDTDARRALEQVLGTVHGPTNWRTRAGRAIEGIARLGLTVALAICVLYALLLAVLFRGKPERAPIARGSLLTIAGLGWIAFSASWFVQGGFVPVLVGVFVAGLGMVMAAQGLGIVRRRRA